jgi:hypothetical protein
MNGLRKLTFAAGTIGTRDGKPLSRQSLIPVSLSGRCPGKLTDLAMSIAGQGLR